MISYFVDLKMGRATLITNPVDFALFMIYFPKLISGPLERTKKFLPLIQSSRKFDRTKFGENFVLIIQGLVRKKVIADLLFIIIPLNLFEAPSNFSVVELAMWLFAYSFALYNDFAGYTSIVRGISGLFGIPLSLNFNVPYYAKNLNEFWQRWHISLSNWLRDYVFFPTTRFLLNRKISRTNIISIIVPPMLTMFISALWHGISWHMIVWGGMHGVYLVIERLWFMNKSRNTSKSDSVWREVGNRLVIFAFVSLAWVPFRANIAASVEFFGIILSPMNWLQALSNPDIIKFEIINRFGLDIFMLVGTSLVLDFFHERNGELAILEARPFTQALALNFAIWTIFIANLALSAPPPFVYQGF